MGPCKGRSSGDQGGRKYPCSRDNIHHQDLVMDWTGVIRAGALRVTLDFSFEHLEGAID